MFFHYLFLHLRHLQKGKQEGYASTIDQHRTGYSGVKVPDEGFRT